MPIQDKVAAANRINDLLKLVLGHTGFRLKYKITVNPSAKPASGEWEKPEIQVDFSGPDSPMMLERGGELMNSLEHLALKTLHLDSEEHDKISFDTNNSKAVRREEMRMAADVAAERVRKNNTPYHFAPMNSRERRMIHLALAKFEDLKTESEGEGRERCVVVYPKDYKASAPMKPFGRRR